MIPKILIIVLIYLFSFMVCFCFYIFRKKYILGDDEELVYLSKFLPMDKLKYLKQLFYIAIVLFLIFDMLFVLGIDTQMTEVLLFDIIITFAAIFGIADKSLKRVIAILLLIPADSIFMLLFNQSFTLSSFNFILFIMITRFIGNFYAVLIYIRKFFYYTEKNRLGLTMLVFVVILAIGFVLTVFSLQVSLLDGFLMVSGAFTSNGYSIQASNNISKMTNLFLIWGGYLLSGVGTASLVVAILYSSLKPEYDENSNKVNELNDKIDNLNDKIDDLDEKIAKLTDLVDKNN